MDESHLAAVALSTLKCATATIFHYHPPKCPKIRLEALKWTQGSNDQQSDPIVTLQYTESSELLGSPATTKLAVTDEAITPEGVQCFVDRRFIISAKFRVVQWMFFDDLPWIPEVVHHSEVFPVWMNCNGSPVVKCYAFISTPRLE